MRNLFLAQLGAAVLAAIIFQVGLEPRISGIIAGLGFIAVGVFGIMESWPERRNRHLSLAVLGLSVVHLFVVALPMLGFRILSWNEPFSKVAVWGLTGPEFHQISTRLYFVWVLLVVITWVAERKRKKDPPRSFSKKS